MEQAQSSEVQTQLPRRIPGVFGLLAQSLAYLRATTKQEPGHAHRFGFKLTHEASVTLLATVASVSAYIWYAVHGYTLAYGDSVSHMMIARRVLFSRTPGLGQLGSIWPPFNHILMLPFIWIDPLYHSGLAGAIPSMASYVVATLYLFRSARLLFASAGAGWVAAAIFALNPNILYMQSTPMSELVLLGAICVNLFYLIRWTITHAPSDLVIAAAAIAAGTLVRYDAWALATVELLVVTVVMWRASGREAAEAHLILFALLGLAGGAAWFLYNWVIFRNPFYFLYSPYSVQYQEHQHLQSGGLPTYHNVLLSFQEYIQATVDMMGWPLFLLGLTGLVYVLVRFRLAARMLPAYSAWVLFVYNVLFLILGLSVLYTPEIHTAGGTGYFNMRYSLMVLPEVALFVASLAIWRREWIAAGLLMAVLFSGLNPLLGLPYALREPVSLVRGKGPQAVSSRRATELQARWLEQHYHGGTVLIGSAPFTTLVFDSGLPDRAFLDENTPVAFNQAVLAPEYHATWIVMNAQNFGIYDAVLAALGKRTDWQRYYVLRTTMYGVQFYQLLGSK